MAVGPYCGTYTMDMNGMNALLAIRVSGAWKVSYKMSIKARDDSSQFGTHTHTHAFSFTDQA